MSISDNPNRGLSDVAVAVGDFARDPGSPSRAEGKRFDLATVLLHAILGMVAGANSYGQMHEFIRVYRRRLNEAFGLALRYAPSYTGLRDILQGVDPGALEAAFRAHASSIPTSSVLASGGLVATAVDGKTLRGSFHAFADKKVCARYSPSVPLGNDRRFVQAAAVVGVDWAAASCAAFQFQGRSSSIALAGWSGNLARTKASQACGLTSFNLQLCMSV